MEWGIIVYSTSCRRVRSPGHVYGGKTFLKARLLPNPTILLLYPVKVWNCMGAAGRLAIMCSTIFPHTYTSIYHLHSIKICFTDFFWW